MGNSTSIPLNDDLSDDQTGNDDVLDAAAIIPRPNARSQAADALLQDHRVQAFLGARRDGESGNTYNKIVGGGTLGNDYSRHPNISVQVNPTTKSTTAWAYQFNNPTWNEQSSKLNLQDFSPHSQDLAAVNLLRELGAIPKLLSGDIDGTIFSAAQRWDSLPIDNRGVSKWGSKAPLDRFKNNYYGHLY